MTALQLVWFKRDLRLRDHAPLAEAAARGPVLGLYIYEPALLAAPDAHACQLAFVNDCLAELRAGLVALGGRLLIQRGEAVAVLDRLHAALPFGALWAHEETGNLLSFRRDQRVGRWARDRGLPFVEIPQNGVVRRLRDRDGWAARWHQRMARPLVPVPGRLHAPELPEDVVDEGVLTPEALGLSGRRPGAQRGGEDAGWQTLASFLKTRGVDYPRQMSSPLSAAEGCSRISPFLAWGALSVRQAHQAGARQQQRVAEDRRRAARDGRGPDGGRFDARWGRSLAAWQERLRWHCHFIQKLESAPGLERQNVNRAYDGMRPETPDPARLAAWAEGRTGWPLVDACMRCLDATGWINFRMRAMLLSVASYPLWLHWRAPGLHLARRFVDYEPGIHWAQVQMQAGVTGINTPRIYNPTKQAQDQDPEGVFIRRWVPELAAVPPAFVHAPWTMPPLTQRFCGVHIGRDYPPPVVDFARAIRGAKERLGRVRNSPAARAAAAVVLERHGSRRRSRWGRGPRRR